MCVCVCASACSHVCVVPQVKNFKEYVQLYLKGREGDDEEGPRKVVHDVVNQRWEVCVTASDNGFQQASFVNSIATYKVIVK